MARLAQFFLFCFCSISRTHIFNPFTIVILRAGLEFVLEVGGETGLAEPRIAR